MTPRRRLVAATALLCAALLAGCSDDDEPGADPSDDPSSDPSSSSASATTDSATPSEPVSTEASATPTGGPVVQLRDLTVQAPEGWTVFDKIDDQQVVFQDNQPESGLITVNDDTALPNEDLEAVAGLALESADATGHDPERVENRTVAGREGYVLVGSSAAYEKYYQWGTRTEDNWARISFEWVIAPANGDQVIEQVLAGLQFTG